MRVIRYEGNDEEAILEQIKEEMGEQASIVSTRIKPYPAPIGWFRKPRIIVTAAYEEDTTFMTEDDDDGEAPAAAHDEKKPHSPVSDILEAARNTKPATDEDSMEESLTLLLQEARKATLATEGMAPKSKNKGAAKAKNEKTTHSSNESKTAVKSTAPALRDYPNTLVQAVYDTLIEQDIEPQVAVSLLADIADTPPEEKDPKGIIAVVYKNIIDMLGTPVLIDPTEEKPATIVLMGPTGVGKTTTIAKLASVLTLEHEKAVALVTADTYRIAAVEQLKTYADILGLDIRTVYKPDELTGFLTELVPPNDIILIDTAGRSHKNKNNLDDLGALLDQVPEAKKYLVLSVATRYKDLEKVVKAYSNAADFNIIFTKLDESDTLGNVVNVCSLTGKKPAYITFGQSVPEDFAPIKAEMIAKSVLGLSSETPWDEAAATAAAHPDTPTPEEAS
jgi:flagellar biosynthesis protein FlhF